MMSVLMIITLITQFVLLILSIVRLVLFFSDKQDYELGVAACCMIMVILTASTIINIIIRFIE
jgi:hypothetical protein